MINENVSFGIMRDFATVKEKLCFPKKPRVGSFRRGVIDAMNDIDIRVKELLLVRDNYKEILFEG